MMDINQATQLAIKLSQENPGYNCRVLADNTVACVFDLMFTRAIILGVSESSMKRRFCFEDRTLANIRFVELKSENDEPQGYIARRPK